MVPRSMVTGRMGREDGKAYRTHDRHLNFLYVSRPAITSYRRSMASYMEDMGKLTLPLDPVRLPRNPIATSFTSQ